MFQHEVLVPRNPQSNHILIISYGMDCGFWYLERFVALAVCYRKVTGKPGFWFLFRRKEDSGRTSSSFFFKEGMRAFFFLEKGRPLNSSSNFIVLRTVRLFELGL